MIKTSIYLPADVKRALATAADAEGVSQAEFIRDAVRRRVMQVQRSRPRAPLFDPEGDETTRFAEHVDELLADGFGR